MIATKPGMAKSSTRIAHWGVFLIALLSLSGCSILPEREPISVYEPVLAEPVAHPEWPQANWSLLVARPVASQQLDSERITVRPSPGSLQVYKGAAWSDNAPDLMQSALLRRFQDAENILSVSRSGGGVRGQFQLLSDLRSFESVYVQPGQPQAVVELYVRLVRTSDGQVVAARGFREVEAAADDNLGSVVDAFSRSINRLTDQVVGWALVSGNQSASKSAASKAGN
jgi:cholesterol transport system auxiliary component